MDLLLYCDEPKLKFVSQISGICCIYGWAAPKSEISAIDIFIDGNHAGKAFYGFARPDVIQADPKLGHDIRVGFAFRLDATKLAAGMHTLRIAATGKDGGAAALEGMIEVSAAGPAKEDTPVDVSTYRLPAGRSGLGSVNQPVDVSIVIFARNQAEVVDRSLSAISRQKTSLRFEVIGCDTESDDGTPQVFRRYGARVVPIRADDFHHVRTRLKSLSEASGKLVVFLVGDAVPADEHWLDGLVRPLIEDDLVAAVYSRQLPAANCVPWEARDIYLGCSVVREVKQVDWSNPAEVDNYRKHQWKFISFSDVSSCYRREVLRTLPIPEALPEVEDQYWCKCLLERGYRVVFEPTSVVVHSHNHSLRELYGRQVRFGRCFATFMDAQAQPMHKLLFRSIEDTVGDLFFIAGGQANWLRKCKWAVQAPFMRFARRYGLRRGFLLGGFGSETRKGHDLGRAATTREDVVQVERSK